MLFRSTHGASGKDTAAGSFQTSRLSEPHDLRLVTINTGCSTSCPTSPSVQLIRGIRSYLFAPACSSFRRKAELPQSSLLRNWHHLYVPSNLPLTQILIIRHSKLNMPLQIISNINTILRTPLLKSLLKINTLRLGNQKSAISPITASSHKLTSSPLSIPSLSKIVSRNNA